MTTAQSVQVTRTGQAPPSVERYTIEQLARTVGMSPRNIRAHQTRRLIDPPVREGRTAYYDAQHLRRLEAIQSLQEQGFNLTAIEAMLATPGAVPGDLVPNDLVPALHRAATDDPRLVPGLSRHGLVGRDGDGSLRPLQTRILRSALELDQAGLTAAQSLRLLVEVLDDLRVVADKVGRATEARIQAVRRSAQTGMPQTGMPQKGMPQKGMPRAGMPSWEEIDGGAGHTDGLGELLAQAFRFAVGDRAGVSDA
jgi:DNA-binding transcriptional MerR regulator